MAFTYSTAFGGGDILYLGYFCIGRSQRGIARLHIFRTRLLEASAEGASAWARCQVQLARGECRMLESLGSPPGSVGINSSGDILYLGYFYRTVSEYKYCLG